MAASARSTAAAADPILTRLAELERRTAPLHPDAESREELAEAAFVHAEALLDEVERGRASVRDRGDRSITEFPIGPDPLDPPTVFSLLVRHVDGVGMSPTLPGSSASCPAAISTTPRSPTSSPPSATATPGISWAAPAPSASRIRCCAGSRPSWGPRVGRRTLASGGSLANLSAIVTAREAAGLRAEQVSRAVVYTTEHHCVPKGLRIAGLGECVIRRVPMDAGHRMDPEALDRLIGEDAGAGRIPWLIVATAGTVDAGAVDPLDAIADVAARRRLWLHVDGAYGAMFALCEEGADPRGDRALGLARRQSAQGPAHPLGRRRRW